MYSNWNFLRCLARGDRSWVGYTLWSKLIMINSYPVNNLKNVIGCPLCCCYVIKIWTSLAQLHSTKHDWKKYLLKINSWSMHVASIRVMVCEGIMAIRSGTNMLCYTVDLVHFQINSFLWLTFCPHPLLRAILPIMNNAAEQMIFDERIWGILLSTRGITIHNYSLRFNSIFIILPFDFDYINVS